MWSGEKHYQKEQKEKEGKFLLFEQLKLVDTENTATLNRRIQGNGRKRNLF